MQSEKFWLQVVLDLPLPGPFDYWHSEPVEVGYRVLVPFGRRKLIGIVVANLGQPQYDVHKIRAIEQVLDDLPALPRCWLNMGEFAARYYQRPLGEVLLPALPAPLRTPAAYTGKRSAGGPVARLRRRDVKKEKPAQVDLAPKLTAEQEQAVQAIHAALKKTLKENNEPTAAHTPPPPFLLYGVTGSGKTEVYLQAALKALK